MTKQKFKAPTPRVGVQRLLRLAKYMRTVPRKEFDQEFWCNETECGTAMCVAGHATHVVRELRIKKFTDQWGDKITTVRNLRTRTEDGHQAFADAFALDFDETYDDITSLSAPHRTPAEAAKSLRAKASQLAARSGLKIHRDGRVTKGK